MFIADDLGTWLVALVADGARRRLVALVLGDEVERALHSASKAAVEQTAVGLCPDDDDRAGLAASVINEVFKTPMSDAVVLSQQTTVLGALQSGVSAQLAILDDASLTGTGTSSADALGLPVEVIAEKLGDNLVQQVTANAAHGGPLAPLADQLNHDRTYRQGQESKDAIQQILAAIQGALASPEAAPGAQAPATDPDIALHVEQCFQDLQLDQHDEAERRLNRLFMHMTREQQRAMVAAILGVATTTGSHTTQLVASNLLEAADRLDPILIEIEEVEALARSTKDALRGCAANLMWQWAESIPGRVPISLLARLTQPSAEDWYVQAPARCAAKRLLLRRPAARAIFDRMASSTDRDDRDYAVGDLLEVAKIEPRAVPRDLARKLAHDEVADVAARGIKLILIL